jgi:hypothetical protein
MTQASMNRKRIVCTTSTRKVKEVKAMKRNVFSLSAAAAVVVFGTGAALAENHVAGVATNPDVVINDASNWTILRQVNIVIPAGDGSHDCVATASTDVTILNGDLDEENQYLFVLTRNDANPTTNGGSERTLALIDNTGVDDPNTKPVATTRPFFNIRDDNGIAGGGTHTFYFLGRKGSSLTADGTSEDVSFSVICVETD